MAVSWWWLFETTPLLLPPRPTGGLGSCHPPHRSAWWRPRRVELLSRRAFAFPLSTLHPSPGGRGLWPTLYAATTARWGEMMIRLCVLSTQVTIYTYSNYHFLLSHLSLSLSQPCRHPSSVPRSQATMLSLASEAAPMTLSTQIRRSTSPRTRSIRLPQNVPRIVCPHLSVMPQPSLVLINATRIKQKAS